MESLSLPSDTADDVEGPDDVPEAIAAVSDRRKQIKRAKDNKKATKDQQVQSFACELEAKGSAPITVRESAHARLLQQRHTSSCSQGEPFAHDKCLHEKRVAVASNTMRCDCTARETNRRSAFCKGRLAGGSVAQGITSSRT